MSTLDEREKKARRSENKQSTASKGGRPSIAEGRLREQEDERLAEGSMGRELGEEPVRLAEGPLGKRQGKTDGPA